MSGEGLHKWCVGFSSLFVIKTSEPQFGVLTKTVVVLWQRCLGEYQALLADTITAELATKQGDEGKTILTSWSEAKKVLKLDPCYGKVPHHERESLWRRYVEDMQRWLKGGRSSVLKHERPSVANTEGGKQSSGLRYTPSNRR
jgi:transcription elongation regulator 1